MKNDKEDRVSDKDLDALGVTCDCIGTTITNATLLLHSLSAYDSTLLMHE